MSEKKREKTILENEKIAVTYLHDFDHPGTQV